MEVSRCVARCGRSLLSTATHRVATSPRTLISRPLLSTSCSNPERHSKVAARHSGQNPRSRFRKASLLVTHNQPSLCTQTQALVWSLMGPCDTPGNL